MFRSFRPSSPFRLPHLQFLFVCLLAKLLPYIINPTSCYDSSLCFSLPFGLHCLQTKVSNSLRCGNRKRRCFPYSPLPVSPPMSHGFKVTRRKKKPGVNTLRYQGCFQQSKPLSMRMQPIPPAGPPFQFMLLLPTRRTTSLA